MAPDAGGEGRGEGSGLHAGKMGEVRWGFSVIICGGGGS